MSNNLDITLNQGEDFRRVLTIKDEAGETVDLTGYSFAGQVRENYDSVGVIAAFSFTIANQLTNRGEVSWSLSNTALTSLVLQRSVKYKYDVEMTTATAQKIRIVQGNAIVVPEVTKI